MSINGYIVLIEDNEADSTDNGSLYYDSDTSISYIRLNGAWVALNEGP
jgi:hypothetical protein